MKTFLLLIFGFLVSMNSSTQASAQDSVSFQGPQGQKAAVCLTYDDGLDCHLDVAWPALDRYGFKGTFYCTGNSPSLYSRMDEWRDMAAAGHELGNHTLFHPCHAGVYDWVLPEYDLDGYTFQQILAELETANTLLKAVDGKELRTFAYTCAHSSIQGASFADSIRPLFPAARGGGEMLDLGDIDLYNVPSWGVEDPTGEELLAFVDSAMERGTVAVFMFHSVGGGYLNVSARAHETLLRHLDKHSKDIWTGTFLEVTEYISSTRESGSSPK